MTFKIKLFAYKTAKIISGFALADFLFKESVSILELESHTVCVTITQFCYSAKTVQTTSK